MIRNLNRWLIIAIIVIVILASGIALTLWTVQREDNIQRTDLLVKTHLLQRGISIEYVKGLTGSEFDLRSSDYVILKDQMIQFRAGDPQIQFVYLMGQRSDGTVFFYVDSESPASEDYSPPGQEYPEASASLLNIFSSGQEITEGPHSDRWGTWVSGLLPITDPSTGKTIAVLGTDIDARDWTIQIIKASAPAVIAMLLLVLLLLIFFYVVQRNERERQILATSEATIRESESRYRTVFESTGTAMLISEEDTTIVLANKEFFRITGYSHEDIEKGMSWTKFVFKDDLETMNNQHCLRRQDLEKDLRQYEFRLVTKSGDVRNIMATIEMLPGTKRSVGSLIDITERKEIEAVMEQYAADVTRYADTIRQTNDKLNLMNSITRHDILNQLTVILGYLEMMQMTYTDPRLQEFINKEIQAAQNIQTQIMFTKDYQDIGVQSPQWFDLKKIILSITSHLPLSTIKIIVHFDNIELFADPLFEKVIYTLLENALRHGKSLTTIEFSCHTLAEGLVVTYQDNGEGIPAEYKEAIFQRKFFKHTGLGLFLSRTILGITGMAIRETGEPGKGARFEIMVPMGTFRFTCTE
ncbi:MAG: PAS domain-containing sensor histidine kinase [Methanoregula sp.]|jgi:PAS domain S-box-containing protein|nr:PAS domain-containing sensor histidine kinase [Methanoregula sp.]